MGNATHAVLHAAGYLVIAAAVAAVPPLVLLAAVHGVGILLRAETAGRIVPAIATTMTVALTVAAFWLSFTALRALAVLAAVPTEIAWLFPVIIEGSAAQATVALLALAHTPAEKYVRTKAETVRTQEATCAHAAPGTAAGVDAQIVLDSRSSDTVRATTLAPVSAESPERWSSLAALVCAKDPSGRRDEKQVAEILTRHFDDGWSPTRIAEVIDPSRSTVSRIIRDARNIQDSRSRAMSKGRPLSLV
ncbi:DUF2637 domain-containing protein [Nocardia sp. NPDC051832]|uniref:helix-turn-helix domain-containing protein n=1 Tax=Nocardia sp. NPDC051832 TaxID=3155673 RepID=UPI00341E3F65